MKHHPDTQQQAVTDGPGAVDRRSFLRGSVGGAAVIAIASYLPTGCASEYPQAATDGAKLLSLTNKEYATVRAAAEVLLAGVPVAAATVASRIDREVALIGDPVRSDMKTVLGLLEHLTVLGGHVTAFSRLSAEKRLAYLHGWRDSRYVLRRGAFQAVKSFVYFYAYADDATRPITKFNGPWREHTPVAAYSVDYGTIA